MEQYVYYSIYVHSKLQHNDGSMSTINYCKYVMMQIKS